MYLLNNLISNLKEYHGFFDQFISYQIAMTMLFKEGRYDDVVKLYEKFLERPFDYKYPISLMNLVAGSCYKMNTKESYDIIRDLMAEAGEDGVHLRLLPICFFAQLALNQNLPQVAIEALSIIRKPITISKSLYWKCLVANNRLDDALANLRRSTMQVDDPRQYRRHSILSEVVNLFLITPQFLNSDIPQVNVIAEAVKERNNAETATTFNQIERALRENNLIDKQTIDEALCTPFEPKKINSTDSRYDSRFTDRFSQRRFQDNRYQGVQSRGRREIPQRRGSMDLMSTDSHFPDRFSKQRFQDNRYQGVQSRGRRENPQRRGIVHLNSTDSHFKDRISQQRFQDNLHQGVQSRGRREIPKR